MKPYIAYAGDRTWKMCEGLPEALEFADAHNGIVFERLAADTVVELRNQRRAICTEVCKHVTRGLGREWVGSACMGVEQLADEVERLRKANAGLYLQIEMAQRAGAERRGGGL